MDSKSGSITPSAPTGAAKQIAANARSEKSAAEGQRNLKK
jgi:hypothetical protein